MEIQGISMEMSQSRVQEEVAVQTAAPSAGREQAAEMPRTAEPAPVISDPSRGYYLDLSA